MRLLPFSLSFVLTLALASSARPAFADKPAAPADDCSEIDHSAHFGPIRYQSTKEWCFAYAAADLIGERLNLSPSEQVSAVDVALNYYAADRDKLARRFARLDLSPFRDPTLASGLAEVATWEWPLSEKSFDGKPLAQLAGGNGRLAILAYNLRVGACLESALPSQAMRYGTAPAKDPVERLLHELEIELGGAAHPATRRLGRFSADPIAEFRAHPPGVRSARRELDRLDASIDRRCGPRSPFPFPMLAFNVPLGIANRAETIRTINWQLDRGLSLGINYHVCRLLALSRHEMPTYCWHVSVIAGRRRDPVSGKCLLKVRNSWGHDCRPYDPRAIASCENGAFWIDRDSLLDLANSLYFIG